MGVLDQIDDTFVGGTPLKKKKDAGAVEETTEGEEGGGREKEMRRAAMTWRLATTLGLCL